MSKVRGQLELLRRARSDQDPAAISTVELALSTLESVNSMQAALSLEAKAAAAYWGAWREVPMRFARLDQSRIPERWSRFAERQSPLSTSPRKAVTPAGAMLNYLYALAESECRLALLAVGLDPGLRWAHRDAPYRDSAALDLLEVLRPEVDDYLMRLLEARTFSCREFAELPSGQVRLMPDLARALSTTLPVWERMASVQAERIARLLAKSARGNVRIPGPATRGSKGKGRATMARGSGSRLPSPSGCRTPVASAA
jgi:CRISPR/Cas system-associated endonuclease Cas1